MQLSLSDKSLVVFVDETGHETLAPGHSVFGLGGCAVLASDLERLIRHPWHDVRRSVTGSPNTPLHAVAFGRTATPEQIEAVVKFFRDQPFARLGAIISTSARRSDEVTVIQTIAEVLKRRIVDIARWTPFSEINVVFESSQRADPLIQAAFADFQVQEDGRSIPVECFFMPKSVADPALEVADFVMHAVGRQARRRVEGREGFAPDFAAVFHGQDPKRVSFMEIDTVRVGGDIV